MNRGPKRRGKARARIKLVSGVLEPIYIRPRRQGISRQPRARFASSLPLSKRHREVLAHLPDGKCSPAKIGREMGLSRTQVTSALYALADRGFVEKTVDGWRKIWPADSR